MRIEVGWKRLSVGGVGFYAVGCRKLKRQHLPRGSYPTPFFRAPTVEDNRS